MPPGPIRGEPGPPAAPTAPPAPLDNVEPRDIAAAAFVLLMRRLPPGRCERGATPERAPPAPAVRQQTRKQIVKIEQRANQDCPRVGEVFKGQRDTRRKNRPTKSARASSPASTRA